MGALYWSTKAFPPASPRSFLPVVGNYGYFALFGCWAGCRVIYLITAAFFLPETKGRTLEKIEEYFEGKKSK